MIKLDPTQWQRLKNVLGDALQRETAETRMEFVRRSCANDAVLLEEAESLLAEAEQMSRGGSDGFEECAGVAHEVLGWGEQSHVGMRLGAYEVVSEIGRGGMGAVYLGRRIDGAFEKQVAIKIVRPGLRAEEPLRRFREERQILARLDHPNIARILDGGTTAKGLPYLVMEHVEGLAITTYCNLHAFSLTERLKLFLKVCSAVSFAHRSGVVHRDIKPSNILTNDEGEPKLLDFGIAKMEAAGAGTRTQTMPAGRRFTAVYASPEQIAGGTITPASDIYSLGAVLEELVAGKPEQPADEAADSGSRSAELIKQAPRKLLEQLNAITACALARDPSRRYATVSQLSAAVESVVKRVDQGPLRKRSRPFLYVAAGLAAVSMLLLAIVFGGSPWQNRWHRGPALSRPIQSLAVLPFQALAATSDDQLLGMGMADAVIGRLSNVKALTVLPTAAVARYKNGSANVIDAATALQADAIVSGTVQRSDQKVRVTVQLTEAASHRVLFAQSFDQIFTDIFAIQDSISRRIADSLALKLTPRDTEHLQRRETASTAAYQLYLAGVLQYNTRSKEGLAAAIDYFQKAIATDPHYALAYALMSDCYFLQCYYHFEPSSSVLPKAKAAAEQALALDSSLAEAHLAMSTLQPMDTPESSGMQSLSAALQLNPNLAVAHQRKAWALCATGHIAEAVEEMSAAQRLDPLSPTNNTALGMVLLFARQFDAAARYSERAVELSPNNPFIMENAACALLFAHREEESIRRFDKTAELDPERRTDLRASVAIALMRLDRQAEAQKIIDDITRPETRPKLTEYAQTILLAAQNRIDEALQHFSPALESNLANQPGLIRYDPFLDPLRSDPRFDAALAVYQTRLKQKQNLSQ